MYLLFLLTQILTVNDTNNNYILSTHNDTEQLIPNESNDTCPIIQLEKNNTNSDNNSEENDSFCILNVLNYFLLLVTIIFYFVSIFCHNYSWLYLCVTCMFVCMIILYVQVYRVYFYYD